MERLLNTRSFILLMGVFALCATAKAQSVYDDKVHIGFEGGLSMSGFTNDIGPFDKNSPGYSNSSFANASKDIFYGFHGGFTIDKQLSNSFSIYTEFLVNSRGGSYKIKNDHVVLIDTAGNQTTAYDTYDYELYYIQLPLMIQYHLPIDDQKTSYRVYAGVSPAIKIEAKAIYNYYIQGNYPDVNTDTQTSILNYVRGFQVNPVIGFWIAEKHSDLPVKFFGDIRFEYALQPVFDRPVDINGSNLRTNAWNINFGFGVRF